MTHWPSLLLTLAAVILAVWFLFSIPLGAERHCLAAGGEWFPEIGLCT